MNEETGILQPETEASRLFLAASTGMSSRQAKLMPVAFKQILAMLELGLCVAFVKSLYSLLLGSPVYAGFRIWGPQQLLCSNQCRTHPIAHDKVMVPASHTTQLLDTRAKPWA